MPITKTLNFLPAVFQSQANRKFLNATLDQLVTEPNLIPINGYVGRKFAPDATNMAQYVNEPTVDRANYQLEPSVIVKNQITDEVEFHVTYPEVQQKINYYGGKSSNPDNLWTNDAYSYNPQINLDAFSNYGEYYWLPNGPDAIDVYASTVDTQKTFNIVPNNGADVYYISGYGYYNNPSLTLARGGTYQFTINQPGKPFWIQTAPGTSGQQPNSINTSSRQILGVTNNGTDKGTISFTVPTVNEQDYFVTLPSFTTPNVNFATNLTYYQINGQTLSSINALGGIDGAMPTNSTLKTLIFAENDGTAPTLRSIWLIGQSNDLDPVFSLALVTTITDNTKVSITEGTNYGNTQWYVSTALQLDRVPVITATLDTLYYQDGVDAGQVGIIKIVDVTNHTIDITTDILGKINYTSPNGVTFSNGMKVRFDSSAVPASYQNSDFYVDGVGTGIILTPAANLIVSSVKSTSNYDPNTKFVGTATAVLSASRDQLTIKSTDLPATANVSYGTFPNSVNQNYIITQSINTTIPYRVGSDNAGEHTSIVFDYNRIGFTLPGISLFGPSDSSYVPGLNASQWHYDAGFTKINGQDIYNGAPTSTGEYIYTDTTFITGNAWANASGFSSGFGSAAAHSPIIGFALDGYPIYGPYGHRVALDPTSSIVNIHSLYTTVDQSIDYIPDTNRPGNIVVTVESVATNANVVIVNSTFGLNPGMRLKTNSAVWIVSNGLQTAVNRSKLNLADNQIQLNIPVTQAVGTTMEFGFPMGVFIEDYSYDVNNVYITDYLDQYNGRFCKTPEFPQGTYAYFATTNNLNTPNLTGYPYFVGRAFYGSIFFDQDQSLANPDYLVISRASTDLNPWTRHNRWFHKDIVAITDQINNTVTTLDQSYRAKRPIIEFAPDLQLYDFGSIGLAPIDLYDTTYKHPFTSVEGQTTAIIDGVTVVDGMRVIFSVDEDPRTRGQIYIIKFISPTGSATQIIDLVLAPDSSVMQGVVVNVVNGVSNANKSFWFNGTAWGTGQLKTSINQAPLFDVMDTAGISFSDTSKYPSSTFTGTKIISYGVGTGTADPVLGFPLQYKNLHTVGDIQFVNNYDTDSFTYTLDSVTSTNKINTGYIYKYNSNSSTTNLNVWTKVVEPTKQYQVIPYIYDGVNDNFVIDVVPEPTNTIPNLIVYVNYKEIDPKNYSTFGLPNNARMIYIKPSLITTGDRIDILVYSKQVSAIGYFEIPDSLNLNAQNTVLSYPALGEIRNHVAKLTENATKFSGSYPGDSNLRDISVVAQGGTMLQQSAPATYAFMFLSDDQKNFVNATSNAQLEYARFKNKFLTLAVSNTTIDYNNPIAAVDIIVKQINSVRNSSFPWLYSDMLPYGDNKNIITYNIFNPLQRIYEITKIFSLSSLSNQAVLVYLNSVQLLAGRDYSFSTTGPGLIINNTVSLNINDSLTIVEYPDTDGCWIPETPTKMGLYPKYTPAIYLDTSFSTPTNMIRGHDGSLTPVFNDYRDAMLLELEFRIYNNIKVAYDEKLLSIYDSKPGRFRSTSYTFNDWSNLIGKTFLFWSSAHKLDYSTNTTYVVDNPQTFNYGSLPDVIDGTTLPGSWRACFEYFYDTQRPNTSPWEMLGFTEMPSWWISQYGPAPYTSGNTILWTDLENGYIAQGSRQGTDTRFARPGLSKFIPVDEFGNVKPVLNMLTTSYSQTNFAKNWIPAQWGPVETAWHNSSDFAFAQQIISAMVQPAKYFALGIATNKYRYNATLNQHLVTDTNYRLTPADIVLNGTTSSTGTVLRAAGYLNWITDYLTSIGIQDKTDLENYTNSYTVQLSYRMASFSDKQFLTVLAEQNSPSSINQSIIIPQENYSVEINVSTPVRNPIYSSVIIERTNKGFKLSGYDHNNPYFYFILPQTSGSSKTISVLQQSVEYYQQFTTKQYSIPYNTEMTTPQQVATFLAGYEYYLRVQGFIFDYFDSTLGQIRNWQLSTQEFLYWVQQGWSSGNIIVLGPFANIVKFQSTNGTIDSIDNSFFGTKVATQNYVTLGTDAYSVVRDNNVFSLTMNQLNGDMLALVNLNLVQYEHVIIFDNITQFGDVVYDPPTGQRQFRLRIVGSKTGGWTGTLSPQGFIYGKPVVDSWIAGTDYYRGDLVDYKNLYYYASKDIPGALTFDFTLWLPYNKNNLKSGLLNNFATNASQSLDFYNVDAQNRESKFTQFGLGLIGYRNRDYLDNLGFDDTTQVKFYQGFIKQKGTLNAIQALGNVSLNDQITGVEINEDWAFRVGAYGSLSTNQYVEIVLDERYATANPTSLQVVNIAGNNAVTFSSLVTEQSAFFKAEATNFTPPFLLNRTATSDTANDIPTAGYVNLEDIDYTLFDISDLSTFSGNILNVGVGNTIWTAKNYQQTWDVYAVNATNVKATKVTNALNNNITIQTNRPHNLTMTDLIIVTTAGQFSGFYQIVQIPSTQSFTVSYPDGLTGFNSVAINSSIYKLSSLRLDYGSEIPAATPLNGWKANSKVWVDSNTSDNEWAVYQVSNPWTANIALTSSDITANSKFGSAVKFSSDNTIAVVGAPGYNSGHGAIMTYLASNLTLVSGVTITPTGANAAATYQFGNCIAIGTNYVAVGAPGNISPVSQGYVYIYSKAANGALTQTQVITSNSSALTFGQSVSMSSDDQWLYVGAPNIATVYAYGLQSNSYVYVGNIAGNAGSQFGYSVATSTGGTQVVIGAPLDNVTYANATQYSAGTVTVYDRTIENFVTANGQTSFGGVRSLQSISKVIVSGNLQVLNTNYTVSGNSAVFYTNSAPSTGSIVTLETDQFYQVSHMSADAPQSQAKLGYSVDLCPANCSIYAGAPYFSTNTTPQVGTVYRYLNQGRVFGNITGTVLNPTVNVNDSIRINNFEVKFPNTTLANVVATINSTNIPGITAANVGGYINITSSSVINLNKLTIGPGKGTGLTSLGLNVITSVGSIANPTNNNYDNFGMVVKISDTSTELAVASSDATTIEFTTFDANSIATTFDTDSTTYSDPIPSGSVWLMSYIPDSRNNLTYPGVFSFVEQLTPNKTSNLLEEYTNFGSAVAINKYQMLVGSNSYNGIQTNGGVGYLFNNTTHTNGWDIIRSQAPVVDLNSLLKIYVYSNNSQTIMQYLDYIDPVKGKILGAAQQNITYQVDYDPAFYNKSTNSALSSSQTYHWNNNQVGQVWWDLSTVRYVDYEQDSIKYRTANWSREFPGSSIDVYEWVESIYPPSQYVQTGGDGVPKYADDSGYVNLTYVDPVTGQITIKYYYWVKNKTSVDTKLTNRTIPILSIAQYISNPINSGIAYIAALQNDTVAVYNLTGTPVGQDTILHVAYATQLNSNIIHSEYTLLSETNSKSGMIPNNIYNKIIDSISGYDSGDNPVPDPALSAHTRYGISIRPRQTMFVNRSAAIQQMVTYVNDIFSQQVMNQPDYVAALSTAEPIPVAGSGAYDQEVATYEILNYLDLGQYANGYKVLVLNDSNYNGFWTIYTKIVTNGAPSWSLIRTQSYRTSDYWQFVDWYALGFDNTVRPRFTVNITADLSTVPVQSGDIVKILNNGSGNWTIVQIFSTGVNVVGIGNGTIALKDTLYTSTPVGNHPGLELRQIMVALQNSIFVNQLNSNFVSLFFVFVYYALSEQKYIDWAFKTSFIDILYKLRGLNQPPIYQVEDQDYYMQYIEEVKPYRTTIREYVADYQGVDNVMGYISDFDVPAVLDTTLNVYRSPSGQFVQDAALLQQPQYQDWLASYGYSVESIIIANHGTGYTIPPVLTVTGSATGDDAILNAIIVGGTVSSIQVIYGGSHYITSPVITISGGGGQGSGLIASAKITNGTTRSVTTKIIYDRITYGTSVVDWAPNLTVSSGTILDYDNVAYIANQNFVTGNTFVGDNLSVYDVTNFKTANDRIQAYYSPSSGLPGKDLGLLQSGINYPGVAIQPPPFISGGFDPSVVDQYFDDTPFDQSNIDPNGVDQTLLDSVISSKYADTTLGFGFEDLQVFGGAFVDTFSSHAPEELIPGRTYDTLDMTVSTLSVNPYIGGTFPSDYVEHGMTIANIYVINGASSYTSSNLQVIITSLPVGFPKYYNGNIQSNEYDSITFDSGYGYGGPITVDFRGIAASATANIDVHGTITSVTINNSNNNGYLRIPQVTVMNVYNNAAYVNVISTNTSSVYSNTAYITWSSGNITGRDTANIGYTSTGTELLGLQVAGTGLVGNVTITGINTYAPVTNVTVSCSYQNVAAATSTLASTGYYSVYSWTPNISIGYAPAQLGVTTKASQSFTGPGSFFTYRMFKDMNDNISFSSVTSAPTTLRANLSESETDSLLVANSQSLFSPGTDGATPGVVFIDGERITYWTNEVSTGTLRNLRRATNGTGATAHTYGAKVYDGSVLTQVPNDRYQIGKIVVSNPGNGYSNGATITISGYNSLTGTTVTANATAIIGNVTTVSGVNVNAIISIGSLTSTLPYAYNGLPADFAPTVYITGSNTAPASANVILTPVNNVTYWTPNANVTITATDGNSRILTSGATYVQTGLWYNMGTGGNITDGKGLFDSGRIEAIFIKQAQ